MPSGSPPALSVAWTLQQELIFYMLYGVLFFYNRVLAGLLVWLFGVVIASMFILPEWPILTRILSTMNLEFVAGVFAAHVFLRGPWILCAISAPVSLAFFFTFF